MYTKPIILSANTWNNSFSFDERVAHLGKSEIVIPCVQEIESIDEIKLGSDTVFEEIDHQGNVRSCTWLAHIYKLLFPTEATNSTTPLYIFDNHNHALYFRSRFATTIRKWEGIKLLHIDQHSDLKAPPSYMGEQPAQVEQDGFINTEYIHPQETTDDAQQRREYANYTCNVGNFIMPYLKAFPFTSFQRIKAEQELLNYNLALWMDDKLLLDIDLDFRAPEMSIGQYEETIEKTRELIAEASLVTIATSPYFLDQSKALEILQDLLS